MNNASNLRPTIRFSLAPLFILWLSSFLCVLGFLVFFSKPWIMSIFFPLAYMTLFGAVLMTIRMWSDWINPLSIILFIGFIRFSLPGLLLLRIKPNIPIFQVMSLRMDDLFLGHVLAVVGLLGVVIGWFLPARLPKAIFRQIFVRLKTHLYGGVRHTAILGMLLGFIALVLFVRLNANVPIIEVIHTGKFRGIEIQEGTGKYFYLSLLLIASSVVFSAYLANKKYSWWVALLPTIIAMIAFWVLGGRARAFTPFVAGLVLLWYRKGNPPKLTLRLALSWTLIIVMLTVFLLAGQLYRGGYGINGIKGALSISALFEYVKWAVWVDLGHLHSLAGAVAIGPGVLGGRTFFALLWPLTEILHLPGKSAGVFIAQTLVGFSKRKWGFHATLIGDAYLNFGLIGVFLVTTIFGMILKTLYVEFRSGLINNVFYALILVYSTRVFFESIEKYGEMLMVLTYVLLIINLGQSLFRISSGMEWANRLQREL